jgi:hypothetical protein
MIKLKNLLKEAEDYRGNHEAPTKERGASLDNITGIYPDDIYGPDAARNYGSGEGRIDFESIAVIQTSKGRPNKQIKIYRAIPSVITTKDKINDIENQKKYMLRHGKVPPNINTKLDRSAYYDKISNDLDKLTLLPITNEPALRINPGDWVTINKSYAIEHGKSNLRGNYRILSKTVPAKTLFTTGDSIHEWGYNP